MAGIGPLLDEPPQPMTREDYERIRKRVHASFKGDILIDRADVELMLAEIRWLKKRLQRVEHVLEPLVRVTPIL